MTKTNSDSFLQLIINNQQVTYTLSKSTNFKRLSYCPPKCLLVSHLKSLIFFSPFFSFLPHFTITTTPNHLSLHVSTPPKHLSTSHFTLTFAIAPNHLSLHVSTPPKHLSTSHFTLTFAIAPNHLSIHVSTPPKRLSLSPPHRVQNALQCTRLLNAPAKSLRSQQSLPSSAAEVRPGIAS